MFKNYKNWIRYPKVISVCFAFFSLTRIIVMQLFSKSNDTLFFWIMAFICSIALFIIFHYMNIREELKRVSNSSSYKEAKDKYQDMLENIMEKVNDKEMKQFISKELSYLSDEVKKYIFVKGIYSKIDEL